MSHLAYVGLRLNHIVVEIPYRHPGWATAITHVIPSQYRTIKSGVYYFDATACGTLIYDITKHYFSHISGRRILFEEPLPDFEARWVAYRDGYEIYERTDTHSTAHATLFVTSDAPEQVIKAAYRALSKLYHPDVPTGNADRFKEIDAAYKEIMSVRV